MYKRQVEKYRKQGWKWVEHSTHPDTLDTIRGYDVLEPAGQRYTKAEMELCGCLLSISAIGEVYPHRGLIHPEDKKDVKEFIKAMSKKAEDKADSQPKDEDKSQDEATDAEAPTEVPSYIHSPTASTPAPDPTKQAIKDAGLTASLVEDLKVIRSNITRWTLAQSVNTAHDLLAYGLACSLFGCLLYTSPSPRD